MRAILIGDVHLSDKPPASCTPDYNDQILKSLEDIAKTSEMEHPDFLIFAGDIFHSKIPSRTSHRTMIRLMEILDWMQASAGEILIVPGNHDMQHDRIESLPNQPLGAIFASGLANPLDETSHIKHGIKGVAYQPDWSTYDLNVGDAGLTVMHAPIMPISETAPFDHIPAESLLKAMDEEKLSGRAIYYGHIHDDHDITTDGINLLANFGAISRGSLHELNLNRTLSIGLWDSAQIEKGIERIHLPTSPIEQVLRPEAIAENKKYTDAKQFLETLTSTTLVRMTPQAVAKAAEDMGCEPDVVQLIKELMTQ